MQAQDLAKALELGEQNAALGVRKLLDQLVALPLPAARSRSRAGSSRRWIRNEIVSLSSALLELWRAMKSSRLSSVSEPLIEGLTAILFVIPMNDRWPLLSLVRRQPRRSHRTGTSEPTPRWLLAAHHPIDSSEARPQTNTVGLALRAAGQAEAAISLPARLTARPVFPQHQTVSTRKFGDRLVDPVSEVEICPNRSVIRCCVGPVGYRAELRFVWDLIIF